MKFFETQKGNIAILALAQKHQASPDEIRSNMEEAIRIAWETDDPKQKEVQAAMFPNGRPTVGEFLAKVVKHVQSQS